MDAAESAPGTRSTLRQPFIDTANALASLYKQAAIAERDARDAGSRAAYMRIMQWAARKSRQTEPVSAADVIQFCTAELAEIPSQSTSIAAAQTPPPSHDVASPVPAAPALSRPAPAPLTPPASAQPHPAYPNANAQMHAQFSRDDHLVSDIRKLNVNPRKRQRVDISDTFVRACRGSANDPIMLSDCEYALGLSSTPPFAPENNAPQPNPPVARRDSRDNRDMAFIPATSSEFHSARRGKNTKALIYDKSRRK